jgi:hypothetical protein
MYNVTLRRVRKTIIDVEEVKCYIFLVCVCSLSYPARETHALYCPLASPYFSTLSNGTIFGGGGMYIYIYIERKMCFDFR